MQNIRAKTNTVCHSAFTGVNPSPRVSLPVIRGIGTLGEQRPPMGKEQGF